MLQNIPRPNTNFILNNIIDPNSAIIELNKCVYFSENSLFDGAFYTIKKTNAVFETEAIIYFHKDKDSKIKQNITTEIKYNLIATEEVKYCFDFLTKYYYNENPEVLFDSIFVTVQSDGRYIVNYEYEDEEVQPQFILKDEYTLNDYASNWYNCISDNAPDDFKWIWIILKKEDENTVAGEFYCSLNDDQSNPIAIVPGEYIYMYEISNTILEKFYPDVNANWKELFFGFHKDKFHIKLINQF